MNIMLRLMPTTAINRRLYELRLEQERITRELLYGNLDPFSRIAIDKRERDLIGEMLRLQDERRRRGRKIAEKMGIVKDHGGQP